MTVLPDRWSHRRKWSEDHRDGSRKWHHVTWCSRAAPSFIRSSSRPGVATSTFTPRFSALACTGSHHHHQPHELV